MSSRTPHHQPSRLARRRQARRRVVVAVIVTTMVLPLLLAALPVIAAAPPPPEDVLELGDRGPAVRRLQLLLVAAGVDAEVSAVFDEATAASVRAAQELFGFSPDGVAGPGLLEVLSPAAECLVGVVVAGDAAEAGELRRTVSDTAGCTTVLDVHPDRTLRTSWRCRTGDAAASALSALGLVGRSSRVCPPSAAMVLRDWSESGFRFDAVAVDVVPSGPADTDALPDAWAEVAAYAAAPAVVFAATGDPVTDQLLRDWCATEPRCVLAPASGANRAERLAAAVAAALVALPRP